MPELAVPFADVCAGDLGLALGQPPQPALAVLSDRTGLLSVELRILGCSHQALVHTGGDVLSEVVACLPGGSRDLPRSLTRPGAHGAYAFSSAVLSLPGPEHGRRARSVVEQVEADPAGLVGVFPGLAHAFTAVRWQADGAGLRWETWHSYPQTSEIVHTTSTLEPASGSRSAGPPA